MSLPGRILLSRECRSRARSRMNRSHEHGGGERRLPSRPGASAFDGATAGSGDELSTSHDDPLKGEGELPVWVWRALAAARKVPWTRVIAAVGWLATVGKQYWDRLAPDERREVFDLLRKSKGEKSNLTTTEQDRVAALLEKIRENPG